MKEGSGPAPGTESAQAAAPARPFKKFDVVRILNVSVEEMTQVRGWPAWMCVVCGWPAWMCVVCGWPVWMFSRALIRIRPLPSPLPDLSHHPRPTPSSSAPQVQKPHGGHSDDMVAARGKEGTVVSVHDAGHVRVKVRYLCLILALSRPYLGHI